MIELFTRLGKLFYAGSIILDSMGGVIEDEVEDALDALAGLDPLTAGVVTDTIVPTLRSLQATGSSSLSGCVVIPCQQLVIQTINNWEQQPDNSLLTALQELIRRMYEQDITVEANVVAASAAYDAANVGDGVCITSIKRPDGKRNEHILGETIIATVRGVSSNGEAAIFVQCEPRKDIFSIEWPGGSGGAANVNSYLATSGQNVVTNGGFETANSLETDLPNGWTVSTGTLGTTIMITPVEVQTVVIAATPTAGYYLLHFTDRDGVLQTTAPLAYNAEGTAVASALRALMGMGSISVVTTGTSPNFTHTITFTNVPDPSQLTSTNVMTGGTITHATTSAGSANVVHGGRALQFTSNGSELTTIQRIVTLQPQTQYAVNIWAMTNVVPAGGKLSIDLVDSIGGEILQDDEGFQNVVHIDCPSLTTSFQPLGDLLLSVNEQQRIRALGPLVGGTFTLTFNGQTTAPITWDATAAEVKTKLEALSNIGVDDVLVTGGDLIAEESSSSASSMSSSSVSSSSLSSSSSPSSLSSSSSPSLTGSSGSSVSSVSSGSSSSSPSSDSSLSSSVSSSSSPSSLSSVSSASSTSSSLSSISTSSVSSSSSPSSSTGSSLSSSSQSSSVSSVSSSTGSSASSFSPSSASSLSSSSSSSPSSSSISSQSSSSSVLPGTPIMVEFINALGGQDVPLMTVDSTNLVGGSVECTLWREGSSNSPVFRSPTNLPDTVYIRLRISTPISSGTNVYLDELCMVPMTQVYTGGLSVAFFTGRDYWSVDDLVTITASNDRGSSMNEWANRVFALRDYDLLFPSSLSGAETIDDGSFFI